MRRSVSGNCPLGQSGQLLERPEFVWPTDLWECPEQLAVL